MAKSEIEDFEHVERVFVDLLNKHLRETIKEGTLASDIIGSELYHLVIKTSKVIIWASYCIKNYLTNFDIDELGIVAYLTILSIKNNDAEAGKEADRRSIRFQNILVRCKKLHDTIIHNDYTKYGLNESSITTRHGANIPISEPAFIEKFRNTYPLGFPSGIYHYEKIIDDFAESIQKGTPPSFEWMTSTGKKTSIRRIIAFRMCLLFKQGKIDLSTVTKKKLEKYIVENFINPTGQPIASGQKVVKTLLGYDLEQKNEKAVLIHLKGKWEFREDNYEYMKNSFPEDFLLATE